MVWCGLAFRRQCLARRLCRVHRIMATSGESLSIEGFFCFLSHPTPSKAAKSLWGLGLNSCHRASFLLAADGRAGRAGQGSRVRGREGKGMASEFCSLEAPRLAARKGS